MKKLLSIANEYFIPFIFICGKLRGPLFFINIVLAIIFKLPPNNSILIPKYFRNPYNNHLSTSNKIILKNFFFNFITKKKQITIYQKK